MIDADSQWCSPWENARIDSDIMIAEGVVTKKDCAKIIEIIESDPTKWRKSITAGEAMNGVVSEDVNKPRKSDNFSLTGIAQADPLQYKRVDDLCFFVFNQAVGNYSRLIGDKFSVDQDEGYSILRYKVGDEYKYHTDNGAGSTGTLRTLSALLYLNDDYEGGEIDFPRQKLKIKPKTGMVVMFPAIANFRHASLPITSGVKYTVVTWFR